MPKGGDLHNHITGAVYAESLMQFAADSGLCIDRQSLALAQPPCQPNQAEARQAFSDPELYRNAIDAWSMRDFSARGPTGTIISSTPSPSLAPQREAHLSQILAEVTQRAADGNVQYLELMVSPDHGRASALGARLGYDSGFRRHAQQAFGRRTLPTLLRRHARTWTPWNRARTNNSTAPASPKLKAELARCTSATSTPWRAPPSPAQVFAQILMGFELASRDPRVVALNLVQPEDWYVPMHDFHLHMQMLNYLKSVYPNVHVTLHAGELTPGIVPPDGLRFHIRESIELGKAERIGHGVDVMYEDNPHELLATMARRNIMVEICLTSNEGILGVRGGSIRWQCT